ncbi:apolipoprotein D-like [Ptychodera flava]|uniref:apolipoprotein D-like n=1 Tax=Ptychodera flava TaxID=63121 RepID=UPI00396AAE46
MAFRYVALVTTLLFSIVSAQVFSLGGCPDITVKQNFNQNEYVGTWYEIEKFPNTFERGQKCIQATYDVKDSGAFTVKNDAIIAESGEPKSIEVEVFEVDEVDNAKMKLRFAWWLSASNYWVLDTDYNQYAVVYSCHDMFGLVRMQYAWILGRERTMDDRVITNLKTHLNEMGLDTTKFQKTDQTGCEN